MLYQSIPAQNTILRHLPADALGALQPALTRVRLGRRAILQEAQAPVDKVYFIESGMAAVLTRSQHDGQFEVGLVERFGLVGVPALLGTARAPNRCLMEIEGEALQIGADDIRRARDEHPAARRQPMGYVQTLLTQNAQTVMCNVRHALLQRLARWLLLACDRFDSRVIPLIHELMSLMLGVRRAAVTNALTRLEEDGAIRKGRGAVTVADQAALEHHACDCYRVIAAEYARLIVPEAVAPAGGAPRRYSEGARQLDSLSHVGA
ncbi:MAG: Crp/Fnr family transcriptional regulator [Pseudolabrys sp.]|jgi:CRP-like cAMP-binding protein